MPQIKDVVVNLLGGLRKKQDAYNAAVSGELSRMKPTEDNRTRSTTPETLTSKTRSSTSVSAALGYSPGLADGVASNPTFSTDDQLEESRTSPSSNAGVRRGLSLRSKRRSSTAKLVSSSGDVTAKDPVSLNGSAKPGSEEVVVTIQHLFLQVDNEVKRTSFSGVLTPSALKMLFMEKFKYSPGRDDFPDIYIKDEPTGIFHELERISEIGERTHLKLKTSNPVEQIRKQVEQSVGTLAKEIKELKRMVADSNDTVRKSAASARSPNSSLQNLVKRVVTQQVSASSISLQAPGPGTASAGLASPTASLGTPMSPKAQPLQGGFAQQLANLDFPEALDDVQSIRRDLGIARQQLLTFHEEMMGMLRSFGEQTTTFKANMTLFGSAAQTFIGAGKQKLQARVASLSSRLEELQTTIEDLRTDVVVRRARPAPEKMKLVGDENASIRKDIDDLLTLLDETRPIWKKTWEDELHNIVKEQTFLKDQESVIDDLDDDQSALSELLDQLRQVVALQAASPTNVAFSRPPGVNFELPATEGHEGLPTVLQEIAGVMPDSDRRVKAMEQAEKLRRKQLDAKVDEFEDELSRFVMGKKLKKTGGTAEVERLRQKKNDSLLKTMFQGIP